MSGRNRLLILIPAILLIPILLGMTPLNMAHRLANGGTTGQCKQTINNHCLFNSLVSHHNDSTIVNLNLTPFGQVSNGTFNVQMLDFNSIHSVTTTQSIPLRC